MTSLSSRPGGAILVANLLTQGVDMAFGVPGESYLAVLDALADVPDRLRFVVCRQEGGAAYMAEGIVSLAGSRLYTSAAYTPEMIDDALAGFERVFQNVVPLPATD